MGTVQEKLDESVAEIEKLRAENKIKTESYENLKRSFDEQLIKTRDTSSKVDKLSMELSMKEDELSVVKKAYEELKSNLREKEAAIKGLSSANDRLRVDCAEKLKKLEEENRRMAMALDEANAANMDQEQQIESLRNETDRLRELVISSQKMSSEVEKRTKASKELRQRDDVLHKLEEEKMKFEEQLKWKKEQFAHLVEAHEKIRQQFRDREKEWEMEKNTFLDEISMLQSNLDSQIRISEGLQSRLMMCNQALAHEETRRRFLELQLSESKTSFDNVSAELEEAKSRIDSLTDQRDKEIANLRDLLGTKEAMYKEYQFRKLEQENKELMASLKELQESGINKTGRSSSSKCQHKLKDLMGELKNKDSLITELQKELETCNSAVFDLTLQKEETSLMVLLLKSHLFEVHQKVTCTFESLNLIEEQKLPLQIEVDVLKEMLKDASTFQVHLKEEALKARSELKEAKDALDRTSEELAENLYEGKEIRFELQIWKSVAERLKSSLDENHQMRQEVEASLLAQVDIEFELRWENDRLEQNLANKEEEINELKAQIVLLNEEIKKKETRTLQTTLGKKNSLDLHRELEWFEEEWLRKELENAILAQVEEEKNHKINNLQKLVKSLEQEFEDSISSFSSRLMEMQAETDRFHRTWETVREAVVLKEIEVQEKNMINLELENNLNRLQQKVEEHNRNISNCTGEFALEIKRVNEFFDPAKENLRICSSPMKNVEAAMVEDRLPFRAINN